MNHVLVFMAGFLVDLSWVLYAKMIVKGSALKASMASVAIGGLTLIGMANAIKSPEEIPAWLAGLFAGSFVAVKYLK